MLKHPLPLLIAMSLALTACCGGKAMQAADKPLPMLDHPDNAWLAEHVGQVVVLQGEMTNTKIPQVLGVDVADTDLRGQPVQAIGVLVTWTVTDEQANAEVVASRGAGVFYLLQEPGTGQVAQAQVVGR